MKKRQSCSELNDLINGDRYFLSPRIKTLKAIRAKVRPEPVREPLPPPPKCYEPPRATAAQRRRGGPKDKIHPTANAAAGPRASQCRRINYNSWAVDMLPM
jgi:hypothetical protein